MLCAAETAGLLQHEVRVWQQMAVLAVAASNHHLLCNMMLHLLNQLAQVGVVTAAEQSFVMCIQLLSHWLHELFGRGTSGRFEAMYYTCKHWTTIHIQALALHCLCCLLPKPQLDGHCHTVQCLLILLLLCS